MQDLEWGGIQKLLFQNLTYNRENPCCNEHPIPVLLIMTSNAPDTAYEHLVHKVRPSVIHLMRGQVFDIEGLKVFTFGGASSHDIKDGVLESGDPRIKIWSKDYDKLFRINKMSWWDRELPSEAEMEEGRQNLDKIDWTVDFILTHCTSASTTAVIGSGNYGQDILTKYLQEIKEKLTYKKWFFGHHHIDKVISAEEICLFEQIVQVH